MSTKSIDTTKLRRIQTYEYRVLYPDFSRVLDLVAGRVNLVIEIKPTKAVELTCSQVWEELKHYKRQLLYRIFRPESRTLVGKKPSRSDTRTTLRLLRAPQTYGTRL